jgi:outer membrane receptor protein involved in Fe transport
MFLPTPANSQETTGSIFGVVRSPDGLPLPGAAVTVMNPATGLTRAGTAASDGGYRFLDLPPATYAVEVSLDGFRTSRQQLTVPLGRTVKVDVEMLLGSFSDTIEVTASQVPFVDVTSTVAGLTVDVADLNSRVPVVREANQVALLVAGTEPGDSAFDGRTPGQRLVSFNGAAVAENLYVVNGLNITNFREMLGSTLVPFSFLEEIQVKTGGYEAEYGRSTGGVVNMVTRSGSNTLRAAVDVYYLPEGLQGATPDTVVAPSGDDTLQTLEAALSVGGAIVRDRLFYFAFADYVDSDIQTHWATPNFLLPMVDQNTQSQPYWGGKVDWTVSASHRLEGTFLSDRVDVDLRRWEIDPTTGDPVDPPGTGVEMRGGDNATVRYSGMFGDHLLLSLQAGRNEFDRTDRSSGDDCPVAVDRRGARPVFVGCWVNAYRTMSGDTREAYRADVDLMLRRHSLRAGIDSEFNVSDEDKSFSGGVGYQYYRNGSRFPQLPPDTEVVLRAYNELGGSFDTSSRAAYLQDSWAVSPRLTLNLGVRWESYDNRDGLGNTFIETDDQYAPRIGIVWDPGGIGRSKVHASYGVYHLPIASNTNVRAAGALYQSQGWYVLEGDINPDGSPEGLGQELSFVVYADGEVPDPRELISDNFEPMSQDEVILGYERMVGASWSLGVQGVARRFNQVIEDYTINHGLDAVYGVETDQPQYRIGNPGSSFAGWYDLDGDGALDRIELSAEDLGYPDAERRYYAVELSVNRRFSDNWMVRGSYTWSHLYGNYEGYTNSDVGQSDPGLTQTFDFPALLDYASGDLPNDRRHALKAYGSYTWDSGFQLGGNLFYRTGRPINSFGLHPTDEFARSRGADSFFTGGEPRPRGCCGRTDDVWSLDLMGGYRFALGGLDLSLRVDVFNVFDNDAVTEVEERAEDDAGAPNPLYGEALVHQIPRRVRLGFGVSF